MTEITHSAPGRQDALLPTTLVLWSYFCFDTIPYFAHNLSTQLVMPRKPL